MTLDKVQAEEMAEYRGPDLPPDERLAALLSPRAIAVVGASRTPGKVGHIVLDNLLKAGFAGDVIPVNPAAEIILGRTCVAQLTGSGSRPDLAVIVVPSECVLAAVDDAIAAGVRALVVITSGFGEAGTQGKRLEALLAGRCARAGVQLLGPNCLGVMNTAIGMNASFAPQMPHPGNISIVSQSGALCAAILDLSNSRGFGLAKVVSVGNKANLAEADFLRVLARDPHTKAIACYLEGVADGEEFIRAAQAASAIKPVVVLKAGVTAAGTRAASSHTGALTGAAQVYAAAFRRAGIIAAYNFEAWFDITTALAMQPLPKGNRVAVITNAGGPGILAADAIEQLGLQISPLRKDIADRLKEHLPSFAHVENPIDVLGDATPERYAYAINAALDDDRIDAVIVILTPQSMSDPVGTAHAIIRARRGNKPVLAAFMGEHGVADARRAFMAASVPEYATPDRAAVALKAMCDYAASRKRAAPAIDRIPVAAAPVEAILQACRNAGRRHAFEPEAKAILCAYGFQTMPGAAAATAEEAADAAESIGYPVALKIMSADIIHKSDVGGVRLSLANGRQVRDAYSRIMCDARQKAPNAELAAVYVEGMAPVGREVILGMTRDPNFGPLLMFGLGGIFVEVMRDVAFGLAPLGDADARDMIAATWGYTLLQGARGQAPADVDAIATGLQRLSQLALDFPEILELEINPMLVGAPGTHAIVADARLTFGFTPVEPRHE